MRLREQLYGETRPYEVEKRYQQEVAAPAFRDVWARHPELHSTADESDKERRSKGDELERLTFESMIVSAIDMIALPDHNIAEELRRIASLLESLENNEER